MITLISLTNNHSSLCKLKHYGSVPKVTPLNFRPNGSGVGENVDGVISNLYFAIFAAFKESITLNLAQGSFKVIDFGTNRKRVYIFLLVVNSNLDPILHRFGDTAV